jgi:hypothetical protein
MRPIQRHLAMREVLKMSLRGWCRAVCVFVALMVAVAVCTAGGESTELTVGGRSGANASIAAQGTFVVIAWAASTDAATDIYLAASRDAGRAFGTPIRVNDVPGDARVSGEQPPRVALVPRIGREPSIVVVWTAKGAAGTRLVSARSDDGGVSFTRAAALPGSDASGNRGWEATAVDREGRVVAIWLDHRELVERSQTAAPMHHDGQAHNHGDADGVARAALSKLYFARLGDGGAHAVAGGVCYCCKTALATASDGAIYAAWRHVYPGNVRDIAFTLSRDGGRTFAAPIRVSDDQWVLDGCPENGPAIAVDDHDTVHAIWPTLVNGSISSSDPTLALFYAATADDRQFSVRQRLPTEGTPRHPQIAIGPTGVLSLVWDEQLNGTRRVVVAQGLPAERGTTRFTRVPLAASERGEFPVVAAVDDGSVVAWTSGPATRSVIRVERVEPRR